VHGRLSAGQRRRLALAVTLAREPQLLLLDEPHAGLDAAGRAVLDAVVASSPAEGRTVMLASHELDRTRALAHREVVLAGGVARSAKNFGVAAPAISRTSDAKTRTESVGA
jgi:ABC-2 type transport system ATP-binding protein